VATWMLDAAEPSGASDLTLTVSSGADSTVSKTATDTVTVVGGSGSTTLFLHNKPTPPVGDTTAQTGMTMDATAPTAATLHSYSTDYYSARPGRFVDQSTPSVNQTSGNLHVAWNYTLGSSGVTFTGTPSVRLWVARRDFVCTPDVQFTAYLRQKVNAASTSTESGRVVSALGDFTPTGPVGDCQFGEVVFNLPAINWSVPGTRALELKIVTGTATGAAALYAYDTTTYTSRLVLP
jgi:hypothetical protein